MVRLIEGVALSKLCDYSFGDQAGMRSQIFGAMMKPANLTNQEFIANYRSIKQQRRYMTLFIDNLRLYRRPVLAATPEDQRWIDELLREQSLLELCAQLPDMQFIIFTNLEDTSIDSTIQTQIPDNVLAINAVNAVFFKHPKIKPFPYGVQRKMSWLDHKMHTLKKIMTKSITPSNLLYVNHSVHTNLGERSGIKELFIDKTWTSVETSTIRYKQFLQRIQQHKFMICPMGHGVDCHRNWEVLYLRRVPIMKKHPYLEYLFKDLPVLFVEDYKQVTEQFLKQHDALYQQAKQLDLRCLDLDTMFNTILKHNVQTL